ncbi:MAG TPA: hypothetical protein VE999_04450 [Gemmataceae bacterium]|nr:hypothetical protein [Gemmataceae bacterium]
MTEQGWLQATDPQKMLAQLRDKVSERKQRLFAVACCRRFRFVMTDEDWAVIEAAESFADVRVSGWRWMKLQPLRNQLMALLAVAVAKRRERSEFPIDYSIIAALNVIAFPGIGQIAKYAARSLLDAAYLSGPDGDDRASINARNAAEEAERAKQVAAVRCVFGNPFCPVAVDLSWLTWNDGTVLKLAQSIYDERAFDHLPILADVLEEAGCRDQDILAHCRSGGEHVRGCWVVDLVLGKS